MIGVDETGYWSEAKNINPVSYYLGLSAGMPFHGPLFFYANYLITLVSGDNLLAFRMPSILFSFATIILFYIFAKSLFSRKTAIIASLLLATSVSFNIISVYRLPHIDYCFFLLACLLSFILALRTGNGKYLVLSFLIAGIAFLINLLGIMLLATLAISLIILKNRFIQFSRKKYLIEVKISKHAWIAFGVLILLILICSPMQIFKGEAITRYEDSKRAIQTEKSIAQESMFSPQFINAVLSFESGLSRIFTIIMVLGIIAVFIIPFKDKALLPVPIFVIIYSFIMSFTQGVAWYIVPVLMFSYLFFSAGIFIALKKMFSRVNERTFNHVSTAAVILIIVLVLFAFSSKLEEGRYKHEVDMNFPSHLYKDAYDYLKNKNESGIYVLSNSAGLFRYYSHADGFNATFFDFPRYNFNATLKNTNKFLPQDHPYYDYVIRLSRSTDDINNSSNLYATLQDISAKCELEAILDNERFNDFITKISVFNCRKMTLDI